MLDKRNYLSISHYGLAGGLLTNELTINRRQRVSHTIYLQLYGHDLWETTGGNNIGLLPPLWETTEIHDIIPNQKLFQPSSSNLTIFGLGETKKYWKCLPCDSSRLNASNVIKQEHGHYQ